MNTNGYFFSGVMFFWDVYAQQDFSFIKASFRGGLELEGEFFFFGLGGALASDSEKQGLTSKGSARAGFEEEGGSKSGFGGDLSKGRLSGKNPLWVAGREQVGVFLFLVVMEGELVAGFLSRGDLGLEGLEFSVEGITGREK